MHQIVTAAPSRLIRPELKTEARANLATAFPAKIYRARTLALLKRQVRFAYEQAALPAEPVGKATVAEHDLENITIEGASKEAVVKAMRRYMTRYPWEGYLTSFRPPYQQPDDTWIVHGRRRHSCD